MKIVALADTHNQHDHVILPKGDVLVHAGDFCGHGTPDEVRDYVDWLENRDFEHIIQIAGNHERCLEPGSPRRDALLEPLHEASTYLEDEAVTLDGVTFYGSPWTPAFQDWAFMRQRGEDLRSVWTRIPETTDVLVTHGPPYGIGDRVLAAHPVLHDPDERKPGKRVGDRELLRAIDRIQPEYHICGHIHEGYGVREREGQPTTYLNVSVLDERYRVSHDPVVLEIESGDPSP